MISKFYKYYKYFSILSLDIVAGSMIGAIYFSKVFNVYLRVSGLLSLGLCVWIIYTSDHLLDARRVKKTASTERHRFHQENQKILWVLIFTAIALVCILLLFIRNEVLAVGFVLSGIVIFYFLILKQLKYLKEFAGALLYSGGVLLIPLALAFDHINTESILLIIQFILTALINLILFSWFDQEKDEQDGRISFATHFGAHRTRSTLVCLFAINAILFITCFFLFQDVVFEQGILMLMNVALLIIAMNKNFFMVDDRYRWFGDAIFFFPSFYILLN